MRAYNTVIEPSSFDIAVVSAGVHKDWINSFIKDNSRGQDRNNSFLSNLF